MYCCKMTFEGSLGWSGRGDEEEDFSHERNFGREGVVVQELFGFAVQVAIVSVCHFQQGQVFSIL